MADPTTAPAAAPAAAGASMADIDMKLLWTAGAVGLYATGTLLNGLRKAWNNAAMPNAAAAAINATTLEVETYTHQAWEAETYEDGGEG